MLVTDSMETDDPAVRSLTLYCITEEAVTKELVITNVCVAPAAILTPLNVT